MSSSSIAIPTISSSTGHSAGQPSKPPTCLLAVRRRRSLPSGFASRPHYRIGSPPLPGCLTAMQRDLETVTRSFATITVWRFASTIRHGSSGRSAGTMMSTLVAARSPVTSPRGGWYHSGQFDDQRFTAQGPSIADPSGTGIAAKLRGNFGIFAVVEQTLYRPPSVTEKGVSNSLPGVTVFGRIAYSPPDRNLIDLYLDGGIGFVGLAPERPLDRIGDRAGLHADFQCRPKP